MECYFVTRLQKLEICTSSITLMLYIDPPATVSLIKPLNIYLHWGANIDLLDFDNCGFDTWSTYLGQHFNIIVLLVTDITCKLFLTDLISHLHFHWPALDLSTSMIDWLKAHVVCQSLLDGGQWTEASKNLGREISSVKANFRNSMSTYMNGL